jgi:hypothetical protein
LHVTRIGEKKNSYGVLVKNIKGKRPLGRPRYKREDNIKIDIGEMG